MIMGTLVFVFGVLSTAPGEKQGDPCVDDPLLWEPPAPPPPAALLLLLGTATDSDTAFPLVGESLSEATLLLEIKASSADSEVLPLPLPLLVLSSADKSAL